MVPYNPDKSLRIRLDSKEVVFRRIHRDGQKQVLQGDITFYTQSPTTIKSVKVILQGVRKVSWLTDTLQPQYVHQKETILLQEQKLHVYVKNAAQASRAEPGLYTWPFAFTLSGELPESVNWLPADTYICYTLTAEVATGMFSKAITTTENLRLIKSPSYWVDDLYFAPEVTEHSTQRARSKTADAIHLVSFLSNQIRDLTFPSLSLLVSLPQPHLPLTAGALPIAFAMTAAPSRPPRIPAITCTLIQTIQLVVTKASLPYRTTKHERHIASTTLRRCDVDALLRQHGPPQPQADGDATTSFEAALPLPLPPYGLAQSVDEEAVKVRYRVRVAAEVGPGAEDSEAGGVCEKVVHLFPKLFAPFRAPGAGVEGVGAREGGGRESDDGRGACSCGSSTVSLPLYGEHVFDALYSGDVGLAEEDMMEFGGAG
ncbi:hypothetical protein B0J12DRAFT_667149 [Macrophomina phaseolina]|uniref:Arrestin-like N-terminal domain-containing protein n=1 Tax=Macrophomina phaseolina TaxID=35725 RepID=A0ABQ8G7W5_9PEZI|nr:hypothetical protein B0J12DRAFT_667149 [Macrophomina phaseolina]